MKKNYKFSTIIFVLMLFVAYNIQGQTGDDCSDPINAVVGTNTAFGINANGSNVSTDGGIGPGALWYIYVPATSGTIDVNSCSNNPEIDTELAIHELGAAGDCCSVGQIISQNDDACGTGPGYASQISGFSVCAGNTYLLEWGDRWSDSGFDWDLTFTADATVTCTEPANISGCTNPTAINYNDCATTDDGNCIVIDNLSCEPGFFSNILFNDGLNNNSAGIIDGTLLFESGLTSSGSTGPSAPISGSTYLYYETSTGFQDSSTLTYKLDLTCADTAQVSFFYHMYGATIGSLDVSFVSEDTNLATPIFNQVGQVQLDEDSAWILVQAGIPVGQAGNLVFTFNYGGSFNGDIAIDEVLISACESCATPLATTTIIDSCLADGEFYVDIDLIDLQGTASFDILEGNTVLVNAITTTGVTRIGPFAAGTILDLSISSPTTCCVLSLGQVTFDCLGCTNPLADNFNGNANLNDGTCVIPGYYCATATKLTGCDSIIIGDTIYDNTTGVVATDFDGSKWYVYCPSGDGFLSLNFNMPPDINNLFFTNPESFIHDLGPGVWTETLDDAVLCEFVDSTGVASNGSVDPEIGGSTYSTITPLVGGNVYAIELGNSWTQYEFDWDWAFNCEPVSNVSFDGTAILAGSTTAIAQISYGNPTANVIQSCVTYSAIGSNNIDTLCTTVQPSSNATVVFPESGSPGLSPGVEYEYCIFYECTDGSGCFSFPVCETFIAVPTCLAPDVEVTGTCVANGFFTLNIEVTNPSAFTYVVGLNTNPSGFNVFETSNLNNPIGTIISPNDVVSNIGFFMSGTPASIQLIGVDDPGCPSTIITFDLDCSCFGLEPMNDSCSNAINLTVDTIPTCDGIIAPYTLACASVDATDPVGSCFNNGNDANVWFTFQAPCGGNVSISTDYAGGVLDDTEIALYSGNCNALTELDCDQDVDVTTLNFYSTIVASNLIAGDTYYIQVDRWGTALDSSFCLDVIDIAIAGCTDPTANNYNSSASCDDGSCNYVCTEVLDITGPIATGVYEADNIVSITNGTVSTASSGPVTINAGRNTTDFTTAELDDDLFMATISATEYIILDTGFVAEVDPNFTGVYFEAENIQCNPDD